MESDDKSNSKKKCIAYCVCERYDFDKLVKYLENNYKFVKYPDFGVLYVDKGFYIIFEYGTIISWDSTYNQDNNLLNELKKYEINSNELIKEEYYYTIYKNGGLKIYSDVFYFPSNKIEIFIAVSYALSQSIKLNYFEDIIEEKINSTKHIPLQIAKYGRVSMSHKEISKLRGNLFITKSFVNLHYELLDEPEFFWDWPELTGYYRKTVKYLDLEDRISALNKKIEVMEEILDMLSDELKHKHEYFLEVIIIVLILIEVILMFLHDVWKIF